MTGSGCSNKTQRKSSRQSIIKVQAIGKSRDQIGFKRNSCTWVFSLRDHPDQLFLVFTTYTCLLDSLLVVKMCRIVAPNSPSNTAELVGKHVSMASIQAMLTNVNFKKKTGAWKHPELSICSWELYWTLALKCFLTVLMADRCLWSARQCSGGHELYVLPGNCMHTIRWGENRSLIFSRFCFV